MYSVEVKSLLKQFEHKKPSSNFKRWQPDLYNKLVSETSFLQHNASTMQRLWHVQHETQTIPLCIICNEHHTTWNDKDQCYRDFCSMKCANNSPNVKAKRKQTMIDRYNVEHYTQADAFNNQRIATNKQKRGVNWATQTDETQRKIQQTMLEKYGNKSYTRTEDYKTKTQSTVRQRYNVDFVSQRNIPPDSLSKLNDYDWMYQYHYINKQPITNMAIELKVDTTTIVSYLKQHNLQVQYYNNSYPERYLCNLLEEYNIKYISNSRSIIPPLELDIYLPDYNLAIEYCGLYWHSTAHNRITPNYHKQKLIACNNKGIRLITIFEDEWVHNQQLVERKLLTILHKLDNDKVFARKCKIVDVDNKTKSQFFNQYHIQGDGPGSINIGLEYNNELVACMTFIKQQNNVFILNRYATNKQVVGGFSKLLSYFKKNYQWNQVISFADLRWSTGNMYEVNGFQLEKILPVDYYYVDMKNLKRIHKFNFRHKNLPNILGEGYDPNLSETQNTHNNGWYRIYNCGLLRYVLPNW